MSPAIVRWRSRLWWFIPVFALAAMLGLELGWGSQVHRLPEAEPVIEARAVTPALLPEYKIEGGLPGRAETVNRTLFNPTRRPAPVALAEAGRTQMQRGQFLLTGTSLSGTRNIAFLKEVSGGKARTVRQGEQINGMLVAEVTPDRVRLSLGGDSEELVLKVATGPKTTAVPGAQPGAAPGAGTPGANGTPQAGTPTPRVGQPQVTPGQRRRAAAQAATDAEVLPTPTPPSRAGILPGSPQAPATGAAGQGTPASADANWNEVFERMRQRGQPSK